MFRGLIFITFSTSGNDATCIILSIKRYIKYFFIRILNKTKLTSFAFKTKKKKVCICNQILFC